MKRRTLRCKDWAVLRGQRVRKYSSEHKLYCPNGSALLPSQGPILEVSLKFFCAASLGTPHHLTWAV